MRISNYCGGYSLYEVLISITVVVIISGLNKFPLLLLIDRSEIINTADQFKDSLQQAKWMVLTKLKSHRIKIDSGILILQKINAESYQTVSQVKIPEGISVSSNLWPSFSGFLFASVGSILIKNKDYITKVVISPIGRIPQNAVERK